MKCTTTERWRRFNTQVAIFATVNFLHVERVILFTKPRYKRLRATDRPIRTIGAALKGLFLSGHTHTRVCIVCQHVRPAGEQLGYRSIERTENQSDRVVITSYTKPCRGISRRIADLYRDKHVGAIGAFCITRAKPSDLCHRVIVRRGDEWAPVGDSGQITGVPRMTRIAVNLGGGGRRGGEGTRDRNPGHQILVRYHSSSKLLLSADELFPVYETLTR